MPLPPSQELRCVGHTFTSALDCGIGQIKVTQNASGLFTGSIRTVMGWFFTNQLAAGDDQTILRFATANSGSISGASSNDSDDDQGLITLKIGLEDPVGPLMEVDFYSAVGGVKTFSGLPQNPWSLPKSEWIHYVLRGRELSPGSNIWAMELRMGRTGYSANSGNGVPPDNIIQGVTPDSWPYGDPGNGGALWIIPVAGNAESSTRINLTLPSGGNALGDRCFGAKVYPRNSNYDTTANTNPSDWSWEQNLKGGYADFRAYQERLTDSQVIQHSQTFAGTDTSLQPVPVHCFRFNELGTSGTNPDDLALYTDAGSQGNDLFPPMNLAERLAIGSSTGYTSWPYTPTAGPVTTVETATRSCAYALQQEPGSAQIGSDYAIKNEEAALKDCAYSVIAAVEDATINSSYGIFSPNNHVLLGASYALLSGPGESSARGSAYAALSAAETATRGSSYAVVGALGETATRTAAYGVVNEAEDAARSIAYAVFNATETSTIGSSYATSGVAPNEAKRDVRYAVLTGDGDTVTNVAAYAVKNEADADTVQGCAYAVLNEAGSEATKSAAYAVFTSGSESSSQGVAYAVTNAGETATRDLSYAVVSEDEVSFRGSSYAVTVPTEDSVRSVSYAVRNTGESSQKSCEYFIAGQSVQGSSQILSGYAVQPTDPAVVGLLKLLNKLWMDVKYD